MTLSGQNVSFYQNQSYATTCQLYHNRPRRWDIARDWTLLKKGKYKIKVLDLNTLSNSDTFNVFEYMHSELDVDRVLEAVTEATKEVEKRPGTILDKSRRLIGSLSYCVFMV